MNKTKYSSIVDEDLCLLACDTIHEKCCYWNEEKQQRVYDLVINGHVPRSKDNRTMIVVAFWLTRKLLFSVLKKGEENVE